MKFLSRPVKVVRIMSVLFMLVFGAFAEVTTVSAVSIIVNTTNDEEIDDSSCSLREAIYAAVNQSDYFGCVGGVSAYITLPAGTQATNEGSEARTVQAQGRGKNMEAGSDTLSFHRPFPPEKGRRFFSKFYYSTCIPCKKVIGGYM